MLRLAIRVRREAAEVALAELLEIAPAGVEEVDVDTDTVEYAVYGAADELPSEHALRSAAGPAFLELRSSEIEDDWADRWRDFHKPLVLGTRLCVRPPWEPEQGIDIDLVIDPGRAFGTGSHATTRLCLEALLELPLPPSGQRGVVDLGCGSGVLGIAAAKLGWGPVLALDYDELAVDATTENASVNGVAQAFEVRQFDLVEQAVPGAPLVFANLLAPLLSTWAKGMPAERAFRPNMIILSGILVTEADDICGLFAGIKYAEQRRLTAGEWAACVMCAIDSR